MKKLIYASLAIMALRLPLFAGEWTEKTLQSMSLDEKIGQLFIVPIAPKRTDARHHADVETALHKYHIGGAIIKQGTVEQQYETIQGLQAKSDWPLMIVYDAEWGLSMRASDAIVFPRNMTLGALKNTSLIEEMGKEVGRQLRELGVHMNLAPVVDVNSNPLNPIIRMRSFGDDPQEVAKRAKLFARGLQSMGVLGCAKHFPGHGDTAVDSHRALPFIERTLQELERVELAPFQTMIEQGIAAVMSGHVVATAIDNLPASLSSLCMTKLLQEKMGFHGLIITDALNMEGLAGNYPAEEIAIKAFKAGHHFLMYGDHIAPRIDEIYERLLPTAYAALKQAILSGEISEEELNLRVRKILETKEKLNLPSQKVGSPFVSEVFQNESAKKLSSTLFRTVLTTVRADKSLLPLFQTVAVVDENRDLSCRLKNRGIVVAEEAPVIVIAIPDLKNPQDQANAQAKLQFYASQGKEIIAFVFGSPYSLPFVVPYASTVILAYEDREETWEAAADLCAGTLLPEGKLPVTLNAER